MPGPHLSCLSWCPEWRCLTWMDSSLNLLLSPRILERLFFTRVALGQISNTIYPIEFSHLNGITDAGLRLASFDGAARGACTLSWRASEKSAQQLLTLPFFLYCANGRLGHGDLFTGWIVYDKLSKSNLNVSKYWWDLSLKQMLCLQVTEITKEK